MRPKTLVAGIVLTALTLSIFAGNVNAPRTDFPAEPAPVNAAGSPADFTVLGNVEDEDEETFRVSFANAETGDKVPAGFYTRGFQLSLSAPDGAQIYYTTSDGSTAAGRSGIDFGATNPFGSLNQRLSRHDGGVCPIKRDARGIAVQQGGNYVLDSRAVRYDGSPITVDLRAVTAFTISAVAVASNGTVSEPRTRTFVRPPSGNGLEYWAENDFLIFSLYSDAVGIYGYEEGIFGAGIDRMQWVEQYVNMNPNTTIDSILREMDSHLTQGNFPPTLPANFTRRGREAAERYAWVEVFDPKTNNQIISQGAGIRVKGGWSRGTFVLEQKTFELYARAAYGQSGTFLYPMFGEYHSEDGSGNLLHRFSRFRLRNGGTDREQTYMRDELAADLARQSGYPIPQKHRPAVVFLNGSYYGMVFMKSPRTEEHWQRLYGGREDGFECIGSNENGTAACGRQSCGRALDNQSRPADATGRVNPTLCTDSNPCGKPDCSDYWSGFNEGCAVGACKGVLSWEEVRRLALGVAAPERISTAHREAAAGFDPADSASAARFEKFCEMVDIDNLMHYYALQIFGANVDWPSNNMEMWRYFPTEEEKALVAAGKLHPYLDGKWRFIGQDFEYGYGLWQAGEPNPSATNPADNTIWAVMNRPGARGASELNNRMHFNATTAASYMMPALLKREDMKAKLANALSDILEGSHNWEASQPVYEKLKGQIEQEHSSRMLSTGGFRRISELARNGTNAVGPGWPIADAIYPGSTSEGGHAHLLDFLQNRGNTSRGVPSHVQSTLGLSWSSRQDVTVTVSGGVGGSAVVNTRPINIKTGLMSNKDPRAASSVTGKYFFNGGLRVPVIANPWPGYVVDTVTGATKENPNNPNCNRYYVTAAGTVTITFKKDPNAQLFIGELQARGGNWWKITNNGDAPLSTKGLFMVDNNNNNLSSSMWALPAIIVPAGESVLVRAQSNNRDRTHKRMQASFGITFGERLRLVSHTGETIQRVEVSWMNSSQVQTRMDDGNYVIVGPDDAFVPAHNPGGEDDSGPLYWELSIGNTWGNEGSMNTSFSVTITNTDEEPLEGWEVRIPIPSGFDRSSLYHGTYRIEGGFFIISGSSNTHDAVLNPGQTIDRSGVFIGPDTFDW